MTTENKFGKTSEVRLETELRDGKVVLSDVFFTAPFKVMLPFYLREDYMQVMVLSASAGIMEGDVQKFDIHVNSGTSMEYLSQAYDKDRCRAGCIFEICTAADHSVQRFCF